MAWQAAAVWAQSPTTEARAREAVAAARGQKDAFTITGVEHPTRDGTGIRDYIHVWDLARAHVRASMASSACAIVSAPVSWSPRWLPVPSSWPSIDVRNVTVCRPAGSPRKSPVRPKVSADFGATRALSAQASLTSTGPRVRANSAANSASRSASTSTIS